MQIFEGKFFVLGTFWSILDLYTHQRQPGKLPLIVECLSRDSRDHFATITDVSVGWKSDDLHQASCT